MASGTFFIFLIILLCIRNIRCNDQCIINVKNEMLADSPIVAFLFAQNNAQTPTLQTHAINDNKYLYPSDSWDEPGSARDPKLLILKKGANVHFLCLRGMKSNDQNIMIVKGTACNCFKKEVECVGNNKFKISMNGKDIEFEFKDVKCVYTKNKKYSATLRDTEKECEDMTPRTTPTSFPSTSDIRLFEVIYDLNNNHILQTIELCHDTINSNTLWAHSFIIPENQDGFRYKPQKDGKKESNSFKKGNLFGTTNWIKPNRKTEDQDTEITDRGKRKGDKRGPVKDGDSYSKVGQWKTARFLLGDANEADKYFCTASGTEEDEAAKFLAKGHLIADGDKLYKTEQDSTYFLANVLPMWQSINANPGYWVTVESAIRLQSYAKKRKFLIWSGGIDILKLPNAQGTEVEFFLDPKDRPSTSDLLPSESKRFKPSVTYTPINKMPVPRIIFKVVVDEEVNEALVFLVINHPKLDPATMDPVEYIVCPNYVETDDPCRKQGGLLKDTNKMKHGYVYCCNLKDFYDRHAEDLRLKNRLEAYQLYQPLTLIPDLIKPVY